MKKEIKIFKLLVALNALTSILITYLIFLYNIEYFDVKLIFILLYACIWFFSLYKIYNFSKLGLNIYISLVVLGFLLNLFSDFKVLGKVYYVTSLLEHLVIGGIISFSFYTKIKSKFL